MTTTARHVMGFPVKVPGHEIEPEVSLVDQAFIKRYQLFRSVIEHEENLHNHRCVWILLVQVVLMSVFVGNIRFLGSSTDQGKILKTIGGLGIAIAFFTLQPALASLVNINSQKRVYCQALPDDKLCKELHGHERDMKWNSLDEELWVNRSYFHLLPTLTYRSWYFCEGQNFPVLPILLSSPVLLWAAQVIAWILLLVFYVEFFP